MKLWILGAGFSRRLGGPLLNDLLSTSAVGLLRRRHSGTWLAEHLTDLVAATCHRGMRDGHWRDPEQFISLLIPRDDDDEQLVRMVFEACLADREPGARSVAAEDEDADDPHRWEYLYSRAIAIVAAQCCDFVERIRQDREAWLPYDRWVSAVSDDDVVVSFNYDLVVEHAFDRASRSLCAPNPRSRRGVKVLPKHPLLLKLHGSVDFRDTIPHPYEPPRIGNLVRNPAFIGVPGQGKVDHADYDFDKLWDLADEALNRADRVTVVGYRCPETDEMSKAWLLDGLANNASKPGVEVVLGPNGSDDARRLKSLLGRAGVEVRDTCLWAQDYLSAEGIGHGWMPRHEPEHMEEGDGPSR